jgi:hypothetical protein
MAIWAVWRDPMTRPLSAKTLPTNRADQSCVEGRFAVWKRRWNRVARRKVDYLDAPAAEKGVTAGEKCVRPLAHKRRESRIDLLAGTLSFAFYFAIFLDSTKRIFPSSGVP